MSFQQKFYMETAIKQAERALEEDEVPVGAVIVYKNQIIAKAYNQVERLKDPTAHAEMIAITQAANFLGSKWIQDATLYVTVEPCSMCAGALVLSRITDVVFGTDDPKTGAFGSKIDINKLGLNHKIRVKKGLLKEECAALLKGFFQGKRQRQLT
jgi:tRNA(adenine34) deaminase